MTPSRIVIGVWALVSGLFLTGCTTVCTLKQKERLTGEDLATGGAVQSKAETGVYQDYRSGIQASVEQSDIVLLGRIEGISVSPRTYRRGRMYMQAVQQETVSNAVLTVKPGCFLKGGNSAIAVTNIACSIEHPGQRSRLSWVFYWEFTAVGEWRLFFLRSGSGPETEFGRTFGCIATIPVSALVAESIRDDYGFFPSEATLVLSETLLRQAEHLSFEAYGLTYVMIHYDEIKFVSNPWGRNTPEERLLAIGSDFMLSSSLFRGMALRYGQSPGGSANPEQTEPTLEK